MTTARVRSLCALGLFVFASLWPGMASAQAPAIVTAPANLSVASGSNATLSVEATGATPLVYRWQLFSTNLPGRTNATLTLTNIQIGNGGVYSVIVTNNFGAVTSELAFVNVDEDLTFRILQLQTNGAIAVESVTLIGDDRGGLVVGRDYAIQNGDNGAVRFGAADLGGQSPYGFLMDAICSDLRTEKIYSLANGTNLIVNGGGNINALVELDEASGLPNGTRINLSTNITMNSGAIFSGYGRIVLLNNNNGTVFDIAVPSGRVTPRGTLFISRSSSEIWVSWGLAEYFTNTLQLVYVLNDSFPYRNIVRSRVGTGSTPTVVQQFTSLADMSDISFSTSRSRWYFHHEGSGQFTNGSEIMGSAKALFSTNGGVPFIYRSPQSQTNFPGSNTTFSVQVAGNGPFTYQWRFNGNDIAGATSPTLAVSNLDFSMTGNYSVEVGNAAGGVVSGNAFLFVLSVPQILAEPQNVSVIAGNNASFSVLAQAAPPVSHQWYFNGAPVPNATNPIHTISGVTAADVGDYRAIITNRFGSATSAVARLVLIVESAFSFKILNLSNDAVLQEHIAITGDDRGGLAVSSNRVIVGGDSAPGMFSAANLSGGVPLGTLYDSLVSDLRTEKVYSLGTGTNLYRANNLPTTSTVVNTFIEINGDTGARTTNIIALSQPIQMSTSFGVPGLFSGYGQVVIHTGTRVFSVALPSGVVADLGAMSTLQRQSTESWAYYGIAENFGGSVYLVYVQDFQSIVRARVPDALVTSVGNFLNLSDMASINASVPRGRWYFHFEGSSQFGGSNQTVGYCSAAFSITPNAVVDHFSWESLPGAQFAGVPFTATLTARTLLDTVVSNFTGTVSFSAFSTLDGSPVSVLPGTSLNFSNGSWTGEFTLPNPAASVVLRATDLGGRFGLSEPFSVVTTNDLALLLGPSTNSATQYKAITYQLLLTNSGPASATAVFATNILPANINLISVTPSQGSCAVNAGTVVCDVGTMLSGGSTLIDIVVVPTAVGTLTNITRIIRGETEEHLENNATTNLIPVTLPRIVVNDPSELEGNSAVNRGTNIFTVQLNTTSAVPVYVQFTTAPGTATNTGDYVTRSGLITFMPGVTETNIRVTLGAETSYEANEIFFLNLFNVTNALLVRTQGVATIINDDPQPALIVSNATFVEGNAGSVNVSVPITLSTPAGVPISINYATSNGTATAGSDYNTRSGVLYFSNGITTLFMSLSIIGDSLGESNDFFYVRLFNGTNINVNTQILVVVLNDDPANVLHHFNWSSIATQEINVPFNATITAKDVVDRTLSNYNASVRLSSGGSGRIVTNLTGSSNFFGTTYTIGFGFRPSTDIYVTHVRHISGTKVSIWEADGPLVVSQPVTTLTNGTWQETPLPAPVRLFAENTYRIAVHNGADENPFYFAGALPTTFPHGSVLSGYYQGGDAFPDIDLGNGLYMVDLSYSLSLFPFSMSPTNIALTNGVWSGPLRVLVPGNDLRIVATDGGGQVSSASNPFDVLLTDDLALQITPSANPTPTNESLTYFITLSNAGPTVSTGVRMTNQLPINATFVSAVTDRGTVSQSGDEVTADIGTLTNGEVATVTVVVFPIGGAALTNSANAVRNEAELLLANNSQTLIVNAIRLGISVTDLSIVERNSGTTNAVFYVNLSAVSTQTVSVSYDTFNSSAVGGADFQAVTGVLVFPPGTVSLPVVVPVYGDLINEFDEQFSLRLFLPTNAPITRTFGNAFIINDDPLPMISVNDVTVAEGRNGLTPVTFTLTISPVSGRTVSVNVGTQNGSAGLDDYNPLSVFLNIPAGVASTNVTVFVLGDTDAESDEYFLLRLSGPGSATLAVAEARGNIINDDIAGSPGVLHQFVWSAVPSPQTIGRSIDVTLTAQDGADALFPFNGVVSLSALVGTNLIAIAPTNSGPFVNGVWSGTITFSNAATNVVLVADDGAGHSGFSDAFNVNVANISLTVGSPPQVLIASPFTYTVLISNFGPNTATSIGVTNALPPDVSFVSASSSGGACVFADGVVGCNAGALSPGQFALVSISVSPLRGGMLTNVFMGAAFEFDPAVTNNSVIRVVEITGDNDHDALPDVWEDQNGLSSIDPLDANQDPDRDGHTSLQEFVAGTSPTNALSVLRATVVVQASVAQVRFVTTLDKVYVVERALAPSGPWSPVGNSFVGDGDAALIIDPESVNDDQRFYRVRVER